MKTILKIFLMLFVTILICFSTITYFTVKNNSLNNQDKYNFVILGLDPRNDALEKTETTDTIIFASLNFNNLNLNLISLPRDLWNYQESSKINQIYPKYINDYNKIQENFSYLTGQTINKTIIITTQNLIDLVNLIDGVDVYLDSGFKDEKYPNPEYIKNPSKEIPIYKTIEFPSGQIHLDKSNVTEFVRSRHGGETAATGGTDIARIKRQQILIESVFKKMFDIRYLSKLNEYYKNDIKTNLNYSDIIDIGFKINKNIKKLKLNKIDLPIGEKKSDGVIYYPNKLTQKQWAFIPTDPEYKKLHEFIETSIK